MKREGVRVLMYCDECKENQAGAPGFAWSPDHGKHLCEGCADELETRGDRMGDLKRYDMEVGYCNGQATGVYDEPDPSGEWVKHSDAAAEIRRLEGERDEARGAIQALCFEAWGYNEPDADSVHNYLVDKGMLVEVPADDGFKAEYDCETMMQLSWVAPRTSEAPGDE